jgi:hypothetical protein
MVIGKSVFENVWDWYIANTRMEFKSFTCLKGVKLGKVNVIENMVDLAQANHGWILDAICQTPEYKKWLLS